MSYDMSGVELLEALEISDFAKVEQLLQANPQQNLLAVTELEKWTWLHKILLDASSDAPTITVVEYLLKKGIAVNAQDDIGMTALHYALRGKNGDVALALLNAGANPNIANADNVIPLSMIGFIPKRLDVLKLMLDKGGNVHYLINKDKSILESYELMARNLPDRKEIYEIMKAYA